VSWTCLQSTNNRTERIQFTTESTIISTLEANILRNDQLSLFTFANVYSFKVSPFSWVKTLLTTSSLWLAEGQASLSHSNTLIGSCATFRCEQKKQEVCDPQGAYGNTTGGLPIIVGSQTMRQTKKKRQQLIAWYRPQLESGS